MSEDRWKKLEIWKLADELAYKVYLVAQNLPQKEKFGMTSQLRRAALSVPTNTVEGYSRKGDKELSYFINISLASMAETRYLLHFSRRLGYLQDGEYDDIIEGYELLGKKMWKFYEKIKTS